MFYPDDTRSFEMIRKAPEVARERVLRWRVERLAEKGLPGTAKQMLAEDISLIDGLVFGHFGILRNGGGLRENRMPDLAPDLIQSTYRLTCFVQFFKSLGQTSLRQRARRKAVPY